MQGSRNWKWSLLVVLLSIVIPGSALAQARTAETQRYAGGPFAVQAGLGFTADPDAFLLTNERALKELQPHLPPDVESIARERLFLKKYDLVVIGRTREGVQLARQRASETTLR